MPAFVPFWSIGGYWGEPRGQVTSKPHTSVSVGCRGSKPGSVLSRSREPAEPGLVVGQSLLNSPLPHRDPQHFPGPGHFRPPAKHSKGLVCKSPLGNTSPGKTFQNNPKPFCWKLPERDEGRTAVPICLGAYLESSCHTQALRHTHTGAIMVDSYSHLKKNMFWTWGICHCLKLI